MRHEPSARPDPSRPRLLLGAGALLGVLLAVRGTIRPAREARLPPDAVALVGEAPVSREEYDRAVAAAVEDRLDHRDDAEVRRAVLDRLVDERLLAQAALDLGLPMRDPRLREQVASAMSDAVTGEALEEPSEETLRAYEALHAASFTRGGRLRIEAVSFRGEGAADRADEARARMLMGQPLEAALKTADPSPVPVPRDPVPVATLAASFGPVLTRAIDALATGEVTPVVRVTQDEWVVRLAAREGGELAPLAEVRSEVTAAWRGEENARRLRRWLDQRRVQTHVVVPEVPP